MHAAILAGIALFDFAPLQDLRGGRLETSDELFAFELISLFIVSLCIVATLIRGGSLSAPGVLRGATLLAIWTLAFAFALNTVGNLFAETLVEKSLSVITGLLALLNLRLALNKSRAVEP
ncbi:MAG: hypothetical protein RIF32_21145 [Leptospirales bacterium]